MSFFRKKKEIEKSLKKPKGRDKRTYKGVHLRGVHKNIGDFLINQYPEDYMDNINDIKENYFRGLRKKIKINDSTKEEELLYSRYTTGEDVRLPREIEERRIGDYKVSVGKEMLEHLKKDYEKISRKRLPSYADLDFLRYVAKINIELANIIESFLVGLLEDKYLEKSAFETHDERELVYGQGKKRKRKKRKNTKSLRKKSIKRKRRSIKKKRRKRVKK